MFSPRWLRMLHRSGWEFWLPLPWIAALVWMGGNQMVNQILVQPNEAIERLEADPLKLENSVLAIPVLAINVQIDRPRNRTGVSVRLADPTLRTVEHEFFTTEVSEIEQAIAQTLAIEVEEVRRLASYRIQN